MRTIVFYILRNFFKIYNSIEIIGLENIPIKGPVIVALNHISNVDPPAVVPFIYLRRKKINILAKKELFKFGFKSILKKFGAIEVDRQNVDIKSLKESIEVLRENSCLVVFPEGTRVKETKLNPKQGIAYLAHKTGALVVPGRIFNTKNFLKLGKIVVMFSKPFDTKDIKSKDDYILFSNKVMNEIYSLDIKI